MPRRSPPPTPSLLRGLPGSAPSLASAARATSTSNASFSRKLSENRAKREASPRQNARFGPKTWLAPGMLNRPCCVARNTVMRQACSANDEQVQADMRTLLRNTATGLYFQGPDQWTSDPAAALDFKMIDRAINFIDTWGLQDMELAFTFRGAHKVTAVSPQKIALHYSQS